VKITARNDAEAREVLGFISENILDYLAEKIMERLQHYIQTKVYDFHPQVEGGYDRQYYDGGLITLFDGYEQAEFDGTRTTLRIEQNPDNLYVDPDNFIHGSNYFKDVTDFLAYLIIEGASGKRETPFFGSKTSPPAWWRSRRDFWTPTVQVFQQTKMDTWIKQSLRMMGLKYMKLG